MTKLIRLVQNYLLYALPFVLTCMAWGTITPEKEILRDSTIVTKFLWEALSWNLMLWFVTLIVFLVLLVAVPDAREKTLKRLANLKERDEREQYITGRASRAAYISTLSLLILLLFFSVFNLNVHRVAESEAVNGKRGTVAIGLQFSLLDKNRVETGSNGEVLFESSDLPLSKPAILLALIIWQVGVFSLSARRMELGEA